MARKPLGLRIQEAVMESDLPKDARHLLHVMAVKANHRTGIGWHSQATLASLTGCSERHVRALLATLEAPDAKTVRVVRRARFKPEGRGRTSDEWQLVLVDQPAQHAGKSEATNRNAVPVSSDRLTGTPRTTNRHARSDQPAHGAGDPGSDPCSDPGRSDSASESGAFQLEIAPKNKPRSKGTKRKPAERGLAHKQATDCYFEAYEARHGTKPSFGTREGKSVSTLLEKLKDRGGADEARRRIRIGVAQTWRTVTINMIANDPDQFVAGEAPRKGQVLVQRGGDPDMDRAAIERGKALAGGLE